jgi:MtN3 and saliva related transmembrane protein
MGLGSIFFVLQGCASDPLNVPLIVTNTITLICSAVVFSIKIYNDYFKKKK